MPTLYDFLGGGEALHRLEDRSCTLLLADDLLQPLFGAGQPHHVERLTAFTAESFGGPTTFSDELGSTTSSRAGAVGGGRTFAGRP